MPSPPDDQGRPDAAGPGTFAALGDMIEKGFKLHVQEQGGKLAGREIQYFRVDDESDRPRPPTTSTS